MAGGEGAGGDAAGADRISGVEARLDQAEQRFDDHVTECTENGRRILRTLEEHGEERKKLGDRIDAVGARVETVNTSLLVAIAHSEGAQARRLNKILIAILLALLSVLGDIALRFLSPDMLVIVLDRLTGP